MRLPSLPTPGPYARFHNVDPDDGDQVTEAHSKAACAEICDEMAGCTHFVWSMDYCNTYTSCDTYDPGPAPSTTPVQAYRYESLGGMTTTGEGGAPAGGNPSVSDLEECKQACAARDGCMSFTWCGGSPLGCYLKTKTFDGTEGRRDATAPRLCETYYAVPNVPEPTEPLEMICAKRTPAWRAAAARAAGAADGAAGAAGAAVGANPCTFVEAHFPLCKWSGSGRSGMPDHILDKFGESTCPPGCDHIPIADPADYPRPSKMCTKAQYTSGLGETEQPTPASQTCARTTGRWHASNP